MEDNKSPQERRRGGVHISYSAGLILVLLSVCLSVLVGLLVHLTSTRQVVCSLESLKEDTSSLNQEELTSRCLELVHKGGSKICTACTVSPSTTESSQITYPWTSSSTRRPSTTTTRSTTPKPAINYRLPDSIYPEHYDLELRPEIYGKNSSAFTFNGSVHITVNVTSTTRCITLHKKRINVYNLSLSATPGTNLKIPSIVNTSYDRVTEFFKIHLDNDLHPGSRYIIGIVFHGNMRTDGEGLYLESYKDNNQTVYLAATQFETADARSALPCFDEPRMKATFNITLVRKNNTGRNYRTFSNTDTVAMEIRGDYVADIHATTPVMSTYLLAFIVCDFEYLENVTSNITYRTIARPNGIQFADKVHDYGLTLLDWFVERFAPGYPLNKLDNIALPNFRPGGMENWGLLAYRERILHNPAVTTAAQDSWTIEVISHEISHQWFGNIVTPKWWWWLWLNEAFASFWDFHAVEAIYPARRETEQFVVQSMHKAFISDSVLTSHPLTTDVESQKETEGVFDTITYSKGGSIVRMMHFIMGEDLFIKGLNLYLTRHQYGNADHYDLLRALTEKSSEEGRTINMTYLMDPWIVQKNFPVVMVTVLEEGLINFRQQRFLDNMTLDSDDGAVYGYLWSIPITIATSANTSNFNKTYKYSDIEWLHHRERNITDAAIPNPNNAESWVIVNLHQTGFYRVNYEESNWNAIIKHLELNHQILPPINRAQIINDAWALQKVGLLSMTIALRTLNFLKHDTEYTAWRAFSREIGYIDRMLERSDLYGAFKAFMTDSIKKSYFQHRMNISIDDLPIVIYQKTRSSLYACKYGLSACREDALTLYGDWMSNSSRTVPLDLQSVVMCNAVRYGQQEEWNFAFSQYREASASIVRKDAMYALTCTTQPWMLERILHMALNNSLFKKTDTRSVIISAARNPAGRFVTWIFVKSNFKRLHELLGKSSLSVLVRSIATEYNTEYHLSELRGFDHVTVASGYNSTFRRAVATIQENVDWMKKNSDVIRTWLIEEGYSDNMY